MGNEAGYLEKPSLVATILCEQVIEDKYTNNKSLIGIFNLIVVPHIPWQFPRMFIMGSFTDGRGTIDIQLIIKNPSHQEVFNAKGPAEFTDPTAVYDAHGIGLPTP